MTRAAGARLARPVGIVVALILASTFVAVALTRGSDHDKAMTVHAVMADVSPLLEGNDVRMNGVRVGSIAGIETVDDGAELTMTLDPEAMPIFKDATATIRPVSLLGERFVDLEPGTANAGAMPDGGTIPLRSTHANTDLDQVLNSLDDPTAAALAAVVGTLGGGLDGNGLKVNDAIKALAPALTDTNALAAVLREQNSTLGHLVTTMERVASGLATGEGAALDRLVSAAEGALSTTATNEAALSAVIQELPATIVTARQTLTNLQTAAESATPTLARLRPTTKVLPEISEELMDFVDAADPALQAVNPVLDRALALLEAARPVAAVLRQAGPALEADASNVLPMTRELAANLTPVFEFIRGWALTTNGKDGLSHYFRANLVVTTGMITGLSGDVLGGLPLNTPNQNGTNPHLPGLPDLGVGDLLDGLGIGGLLPQQDSTSGDHPDGLLGGLLSPRTSRDGSVTGLSRAQESAALNFLLGGRN
jgi:phospholipid/cholesterol/gamma-HCH transport system substrate-binding protein